MLRYPPIALDRLRHIATVNDKRLDLTPKEFQLLEYFLLHPEEVVRRTTLLEKVWDMHFDPESNVVDVHVGNLRRKLSEAAKEQLLTTVRGVGFSLRRGGEAGGDLARALVRSPQRRFYLLPAGALCFILTGLLLHTSGRLACACVPCGARGWRSPAHQWCGRPCAASVAGRFAADLVAMLAIVTALFLGSRLPV